MLLYIKSSFFELDKIEYEIKKPFLITVEKKCIFFFFLLKKCLKAMPTDKFYNS